MLRGIAMVGDAQLVFMDTPGIFSPRRRLDRAMVSTAWGGAHDADIVALLIDAKKGIDEEAEAIFGKLGEVRQPKVLVLNKVDLADKPALLALTQSANARAKFDATFMVSALTGDGVADAEGLARRAFARGTVALSRGPDFRCADAFARGRDHAREAVRPAAPGIAVSVDGRDRVWKELRDGSVRIEQTIYVERESQRKIVLGKGGATIKAIGAAARKEIAELAEQKVHLFLFVKVREGWGDDPERYRAMGLEFPKATSFASIRSCCRCDNSAGAAQSG